MAKAFTPILLGICEGALVRGEGLFQDFYHVAELLALPFFPQTIRGPLLLFAFPIENLDEQRIKVILRDRKAGGTSAWINLETALVTPTKTYASASSVSKPFRTVERSDTEYEQIAPVLTKRRCSHKLMPVPAPPLLVMEPGTYDVLVAQGDDEQRVGSIDFVFLKPPPITPAERAALKSQPASIKAIRLRLACKKCDGEFDLYELLDPDDEPSEELKQMTRVSGAPTDWRCPCGKTHIPLRYIKDGVHHLFRHGSIGASNDQISFMPRYETGAIAAIQQEYQDLINAHPREQEVQVLIESHPIFWNFLAPRRIWSKPQILSNFQTDFAVLSHSRVLYLIEIEKPQTKLVKQNGGMHSELSRGLDQLRDWRVTVSDHRSAVLDHFELLGESVDIRYVLIAGLAHKTPAKQLVKLKRNPSAADAFFCFDELASFLHSTELSLARL